MNARDEVVRLVDSALALVSTNSPDEWSVQFPPPCEAVHSLTDILPEHEEGPAFIYQAMNHRQFSSIGIVACGRSWIGPEAIELPVADRLNPTLSTMAFAAILTADVGQTYADLQRNHVIRATHVQIPLRNYGVRLRVDGGNFHPDAVGLAVACLL